MTTATSARSAVTGNVRSIREGYSNYGPYTGVTVDVSGTGGVAPRVWFRKPSGLPLQVGDVVTVTATWDVSANGEIAFGKRPNIKVQGFDCTHETLTRAGAGKGVSYKCAVCGVGALIEEFFEE